MQPNASSLTITNPLVLYRSLIATKRIQPDPAQHRLALHLQKLYENLIDYEPSIEYSDRLKQLRHAVGTDQHGSAPVAERAPIGTRGIWTSLLAQKEKRHSLALTRTLTSHEAALALQSPKGLMLHGEVGTGKSMLIDLFADCLPNRKKRRWHFNTFMLETFSRLEQLRLSRSGVLSGPNQDEYSLLWVARDLIEKSPILFLDEFQLPDRAASKILSNLMTSFFQLGGVLIATSNRMPEELAKAAGMEFERPVSRLSRLGWHLGMQGVVGRDDGPGQKGEFAQFLEVLRTRCEVWEMEGKKDYRRMAGLEGSSVRHKKTNERADSTKSLSTATQQTTPVEADTSTPSDSEAAIPKHYFIVPSPIATPSDLTSYKQSLLSSVHHLTSTPPSYPIPWTSLALKVYNRPLIIPKQHAGTALFTFTQLCADPPLGPADYITLCSTYHSIIVTDVPVLGFLQKNEARRFITLLDAMYEARCRLLITAAAAPDDIFFPASPTTTESRKGEGEGEERVTDAVYSETYSEVHQDLTSPFRPNTSSYTPVSSLPEDSLEDDPPNRVRRPGSSYTDERRSGKAPDFANIRGLTGEDERFAVKRAESRIWEMCSAKWWERAGEEGWWRPLPGEARAWERPLAQPVRASMEMTEGEKGKGEEKEEGVFKHGASPFRTVDAAPPKIAWTHVWGTIQWGKSAGAWGKGVEGLPERRKINKEDEEGAGVVEEEKGRKG
ncbi:mitochondrial ATPase-like protein [Bimuria novae-zelandiae CBS 107.79]|uniref:Mitochondrial ATPase-like protein n=1 Tax=Bimuria novae-zelandiae CBS 107.79 TaxID=1447943 RepID=A0A6A5VFJ4_9PLEO|nr:mitochondrial ATPase-like protein [Bimuria novae-zelandiae CBS 107.79]